MLQISSFNFLLVSFAMQPSHVCPRAASAPTCPQASKNAFW